mmetsp:Transcript_35210/g.101290  ORF Transcript_35210/g.101290 Transcript_35210/m.101290 type:complete len:137 (+) Transcript_35210:268-678(+)
MALRQTDRQRTTHNTGRAAAVTHMNQPSYIYITINKNNNRSHQTYAKKTHKPEEGRERWAHIDRIDRIDKMCVCVCLCHRTVPGLPACACPYMFMYVCVCNRSTALVWSGLVAKEREWSEGGQTHPSHPSTAHRHV